MFWDTVLEHYVGDVIGVERPIWKSAIWKEESIGYYLYILKNAELAGLCWCSST